ncbi:MAG: L-threonylcarbamoyladenylate synthase [Myxococcota bacterium]
MQDPIGDAVKQLSDGWLVAYPTETVWGIGADATSDEAIARLRRWKRRGDDAPFSILVPDLAALDALCCEVGEAARVLADAFWPGPVTLVVRCARDFAAGVRRSDGAVGVRCSAHPLAQALARRCDAEGTGPITSSSLNRSSAPPAASRAEAQRAVADGPDAPRLLEVEGAEAGGQGASTVVDVTAGKPVVLRWGTLPAAEVEPVLARVAAP